MSVVIAAFLPVEGHARPAQKRANKSQARVVPRSATPAPPPAPTPVTSVEGITEYRLSNGLQVLLVPDDSKPTTTVNLTYRVGSRHESYGETGMAHLLEHLIFKGTPTTRNVWAEFEKRGMRPNGSTSYDRTNYFASFAANEDTLRWYLSWQADAMVHSFIARKDLDTEMTVVRNEFESGENRPGQVLMQQTMAAMYQWHNYGKATIGARSDIENVDIPRLQSFYRLHYQPDNATLIVSGRFDPKKVLGWVSQFFGVIARPSRVLPVPYTLDPAQDGERQVTLRRVGGSPLIYMAFHVPAGPDPDFAAVEMLSSVFGDTPGGRLHKRLVEKQLASQAFAFNFALAEPGAMVMGATLSADQDLQKVRAEMAATIDSVVSQPVTGEELERARTSWLNGWDQAFTDPERVGLELSESVAEGDWRLYFLRRDQVRKVSLADVQRVATTWLKPDNRTVGLYEPTARPDRTPQAQRVDVAALVKGYKGDAQAAQAEAFDPTPARIDARTRSFRLGNGPDGGMRVALLAKGTRGQAVQARLRLRYGDEKSLLGQDAVAALVGSMLDKGGGGLTRQQLSDELDRLQAEVSFGASGQTATVSISTRRERLPAVIELVGRVLRQPAFPPDALEEVRRQWLTGIERQRSEPAAILANRLGRHGNPYPRGDLRYSQTFDESAAEVQAVTLEQVKAFHGRFYSAANSEFAAVGDIDEAAVRQALTQAFGDWSRPAVPGAGPFVRVPRPLVDVPPLRFVERVPDKANANLHAQLALPISDRSADAPALMVADYLFGDSGNSRLWNRIRQREGLSYGVGSGLSWSSIDDNTIWHITAIFAPGNQPRVEAALRDELDRVTREGFTAQEVDEARNGLLNQRRLGRAQDGALADRLALNLYLERSFAFSQQIDDALKAVTVEQVNAAWRKYIQPQRLVIGWGGNFPPEASVPAGR